MREHYEKYSFIDVGNTSVVLKHYHNGKFLSTRRFLTKSFNKKSFNFFMKDTTKAFICSVVPQIDIVLLELFREREIVSFFVTKEQSRLVDFSSRDNGIGADIVAQGEGAAFLYPNTPFCVVSMGTALTITQVNINREFIGGLIMADYKMQLESLHKATAKLPVIPYHLNKQQKINQTLTHLNTVKSIQSGTYNLLYFGIKGILQEIKKTTPKIKIVGTGGISVYFKDLFDKQEENLLFLGLLNLYKNEINESELP